jgi:hypothetical protein
MKQMLVNQRKAKVGALLRPRSTAQRGHPRANLRRIRPEPVT